MKFQRKLEWIEAIQWDGKEKTLQTIQEMTKVEVKKSMNDALYISYDGCLMRIALGEWVIKGRFLPCQDKTLREEYDAIPEK